MKIRIIPMGTSKDNSAQMRDELCRKLCNPSGAIFVQQRPTASPMRSSMNGYMPYQMDSPNHTDELAALIRFLAGDVHEATQGNMDKETIAPPQNAWKPAEDAILQMFFLTDGTAVIDRLEGRTWSEVIKRAMQLGLCDEYGWAKKNGKSFPLWSKEEDDLVLSIYPRNDILKTILNRSEEEIERRAIFLGMNQRKWKSNKTPAVKPQHIETNVHDFNLKERFADFLNNAPAGSTFVVRK